MKKLSEKLLLTFASLLFAMVLFGSMSIRSMAADAPGTLKTGFEFNLTLKKFKNAKVKSGSEADTSIKKIIFTTTQPSKTLPNKEIGVNVKAYFDSKKGIMYIYCPTMIIFNADSNGMFFGLEGVESIDFGKVINTSNVTEMCSMFCRCYKLKSLDLRSFKTGNVTNTFSMFEKCTSLESLDLSTFDTSHVTYMTHMFAYCSKLKSLNVSKFNTSLVESFWGTFRGLTSIKSLDLGSFNTSKVADMSFMFTGCKSLQQVNLSSFNTSNVYTVIYMFADCSSLEMLNLSSFDFSRVDNDNNSENFFSGCSKLKGIYSPKKLAVDFNYDYSSGTFDIKSSPIGNMVLDDNNNGVADNRTVYSKLPAADKSHKYLLVSKLADPTKVDPAPQPKKDDQKKQGGQENKKSNGSQSSPAPVDAVEESVEPAQRTFTINGITYIIDNDSNATVIKIDKVKKASLNKVTIEGVTYPVIAVTDNACKSNNKIAKLSIGPNVKAIGKNAFKGCKKLKKVTIKANKSLKIGKNAFKKLNKKATITVKGIKGNSRKKLVKALKKQTNAEVK